MMIQKITVATLVLLLAGVSLAKEAKVVLRSTVTGNQEQPKVLYIVPWQQAENLQLNYRPLQNLVEDVYKEVERDEFLRELNYREKIDASLKSKP